MNMKLRVILLFFLVAIIPSVTIASDVLYGAKEQSGHFYKLFEFKMTWDNAQKFCESMGGHLATIENDEENGILRAVLLNGVNRDYWLGGQRVSQNSWNWITGNAIEYNNWDSGYPSDISSYSKVIVLRKGVNWRTESEKERNAFICEWDSKENAHDSNW